MCLGVSVNTEQFGKKGSKGIQENGTGMVHASSPCSSCLEAGPPPSTDSKKVRWALQREEDTYKTLGEKCAAFREGMPARCRQASSRGQKIFAAEVANQANILSQSNGLLKEAVINAQCKTESLIQTLVTSGINYPD